MTKMKIPCNREYLNESDVSYAHTKLSMVAFYYLQLLHNVNNDVTLFLLVKCIAIH